MTRLHSTLARIAATATLTVLVVVPPVLVMLLIGRPYPRWSTVTSEVDSGRVSADTVMRIAAMLFIAIWVWIVATIAAEVYRLTAPRKLGAHRSERRGAADAARRATILHRLVRVAVLGTVTTAATVSTWPGVAIASPSRSLSDSINPPTPVTAPVDPTQGRSATPATTTIVANGRDTPLSMAVDLGDEALRDEIIAMNRSSDWTAGVFPAGMVVTIPVIEQTTPTAPAGTVRYVVQPNDGMWNVAEALLGDGARHHELRQLLDGQHVAPSVVFTADTETIHPGWVFKHPAGVASPEPVDVHVVEAGDTLSAIADRYLGDADRWPELWNLNAHTTMPDGRTFTDPNLIVPGWPIALPNTNTNPTEPPTAAPTPAELASEPTAPALTADEQIPPPQPDLAAVEPGATPPVETLDAPRWDAAPPSTVAIPSTPLVTESSNSPAGQTTDAPSADHGFWTDVERSVWPTVVAGSLLTAGLATAVRRLRNRRLSQVTPGDRIPEPPDRIAGTEQAILTAANTRPIDTVTAVLRSFTPHAARLPRPPAVRAVQIGTERIELLLAQPEPLTPRGWTTIDGGQSWTHQFDDPIDPHRQLLTPALVTIGARTDEQADEVLLDLETAGSLAIVGDRTASLGLARSIVLELATYPLGVSMDVSLVGIDVTAGGHCDRVWTGTTIERALDVARRRQAAARDQSITAARSTLDADDGSNDPHVIVIDAATIEAEHQPTLDEIISLCAPSGGTAVVLVGDHPDVTERIIVNADGTALWSGVDLRAPDVTDTAEAEVVALLRHVADSEAEPIEADEFMTALVHRLPHHDDTLGDIEDQYEATYEPPPHDVLVQLMGEPRAHGIELSADQTELLALLACLRHRTEVHIGLIHEAIGPERARKTIENRTSQLRRALGTGSDGHDLMPDAASGRGGRSHYLVSPLVLTDIDLLEHRYHASQRLSSADALAVLRDGLDLMRGPLFRSRRGYEFWPHSEGVIVQATNIVQAYACRLIDLAADADDPALVLQATSLSSCILDNPLAEFPIRQAEQAFADACGNDQLLASVANARRRLLEHIDNDDTYAEAG